MDAYALAYRSRARFARTASSTTSSPSVTPATTPASARTSRKVRPPSPSSKNSSSPARRAQARQRPPGISREPGELVSALASKLRLRPFSIIYPHGHRPNHPTHARPRPAARLAGQRKRQTLLQLSHAERELLHLLALARADSRDRGQDHGRHHIWDERSTRGHSQRLKELRYPSESACHRSSTRVARHARPAGDTAQFLVASTASSSRG